MKLGAHLREQIPRDTRFEIVLSSHHRDGLRHGHRIPSALINADPCLLGDRAVRQGGNRTILEYGDFGYSIKTYCIVF